MVNQQNAGIRLAPEDQVEKPDELKLYEQMRETGLPLVAGGLMDQPHIWLDMLGVIKNTLALNEALNRANAQATKAGAEKPNANQ
jgi:hypothetical protein